MHILSISEPIILGPKFRIEPGEYVVDDLSGAQMLGLAGGGKMNEIDSDDRFLPRWDSSSSTAESVLFLRTGGFGDLILLTPVLREHKRRWPNARIGVVCMADYGVVLQGLPFVDEILPYPITTEKCMEWDHWIFMEGAVESNPLAKKYHMTDVFAGLAGVNDAEFVAKQPTYAVSAAEAVWANVQFPRNDRPRLCVQVGASNRARMYDPRQQGQVVKLMLDRGWEVFMMGDPGAVNLPEGTNERLQNLTVPGLTFRQSCAVINAADALLGPDSALVHVAGALNVPCVALYGPFPWELRTKYSPSITAISGNGECAPCFHHFNPAKRNHFPVNCPTAQTGWCGVLSSIEPKRVATKLETIARRVRPVNGALEVMP